MRELENEGVTLGVMVEWWNDGMVEWWNDEMMK